MHFVKKTFLKSKSTYLIKYIFYITWKKKKTLKYKS